MLEPQMNIDDLRKWAEENKVTDSLYLPARVLQPKNVDKTTWLWLYHHGNISIEQVISRTTATDSQHFDEMNIPIQYQQAAIDQLIQQQQNIETALHEEEEILQKNNPNHQSIQLSINKLRQTRKHIRETTFPRTKAERITGRVWFERTSCELVYKEEIQSWCGDGRWPEIRMQLQTGEVYCKCKKGKLGKCGIAISAIDRACEWLTEANPSHKNIEQMLGTPSWQIVIQNMQQMINTCPFYRGQIIEIGWVINKKIPIRIQPVQVNSDGSHTKLELEDLMNYPFVVQHQVDLQVISLLSQANGNMKFSKTQQQSLTIQVLYMLLKHNHVYCGKRKTEVTLGNISLRLEQKQKDFDEKNLEKRNLNPHTSEGLQIGDLALHWFYNQNKILAIELYHQIQTNSIGNLFLSFELEENNPKIYITIIHEELIQLLQICIQHQIPFPPESLPFLFDSLSNIQYSIPVDINIDIDTKIVSPNPKIIFEIQKQNINILPEIWINDHIKFESGNGPSEFIHRTSDNIFIKYQRDIKKESAVLQSLNIPNKIDEHTNLQVFFQKCMDINIDISFPKNYQNLTSHDLSLQIKHDASNCILDGHIILNDQTMSLFELLKNIRSGQQRIFSNTTVFELNTELQDILRMLADRIIPKKISHVESVRAPTHILEIDTGHFLNVHSDINSITGEELQKLLQKNTSTNTITDVLFFPSTKFSGDLRPYQKIGLDWLERMSKNTHGVCLCDEMGLGKTVQVLAYISNHPGVHLIIAPTSLIYNWKEEAERFLKNVQISIYHGIDRILPQKNNSEEIIHLVITTYSILTKEIVDITQNAEFTDQKDPSDFHNFIEDTIFETVVLDEAQYIKNPETGRYKSCRQLRGQFFIGISGTPIENNIRDIWSIFSIINPNILGSFEIFQNRFANHIQNGDVSRSQDLSKLLQPFLLRRYKIDVAQDLPSKNEIDIIVPLAIEQRRIYEYTYKNLYEEVTNCSTKNIGTTKLKILALLTKLRQIVCHPKMVFPDYIGSSSKLERVLEIISELRAINKKILIFSQFVSFLQILISRLDKKYSFSYLDGSSSIQQRKSAIDDFQKGNTELFLLSLKAGGIGLNLTQASEVLILDPWWNPAVEQQATDRAHRIGQTEPVTIYRFVGQNTIESKIREIHQQKTDLAYQILENPDSGFSIENLLKILK